MSRFSYIFRYVQADKKIGNFQVTLETYDEELAIAYFEKQHPDVEWVNYIVEEFKTA